MANDFLVPDEFTVGFDVEPGAPAAITTLGRVVEDSAASAITSIPIVTSVIGRVTEVSSTGTVTGSTFIQKIGSVTENATVTSVAALKYQAIGRVTENSEVFPVAALPLVIFNLDINQDIVGMAYAYRFFVTQEINQDYEFSLDIVQDIVGNIYDYSLPITQSLYEEYTPTILITQNIIEVLNADGSVNNDPPDPTQPGGGYVGMVWSPSDPSGSWGVRALIGNIDVSGVLVGQVTVNKEADQAQVASFSIKDTDLSEVIVNNWSKKPVTLFFQHKTPEGVVEAEYPIFAGSIAGYAYDPSTEVFSFSASDDLQDIVRAMYAAGTLVPPVGHTFATKTGSIAADGWQWLKASMSTVQESFGIDDAGVLTFYGWNAGASPLEFTEENILDGSLAVTLQDTKSAINVVEVILEEDYKSLVWTDNGRDVQENHFVHKVTVYSPVSVGTYGVNLQTNSETMAADYTNSLEPWTQKVPSQIEGNDDIYMNGPKMADYIIGATGGGFTGVCPTGDIPGEDDPYKLAVQDFYRKLIYKGNQPSYATEVTYEPIWVERTVYPTDGSRDGPYTQSEVVAWDYGVTSPVTDGEETVADTGGSLVIIETDKIVLCNNHQDAEDKLAEMVEEAEKVIIEAHRNTLVSFSTLITPAMTWGNSVIINTATVRTTGITHSVTHSLDINSGSATTEVSLKILDAGNTGESGTPGDTGGFVTDDISCAVGNSFDNLVYAERFKMEHSEQIVTIPSNQVSLGRY